MTTLVLVLFVIVAVLVLFFGAVVFIGAPYVPSQKKYIKRVFEWINLGSSDVLVDIGSGDGIVLRIAARFGAKAVGYEINPILVLITKILSLTDPQVSVRLENFWMAKLPPQTTIVYIFSVSRDEGKIIALLQREANRLGRPLKLLCHASPLKTVTAVDTFEAYHLYIFHPLQVKNA